MFVLIAMSGNTALPALKVTVIKKASEQVIADRIAHSVKETQKIKHYILSVRNVSLSEMLSTLSKTVQCLTLTHRSVEQEGYRMK